MIMPIPLSGGVGALAVCVLYSVGELLTDYGRGLVLQVLYFWLLGRVAKAIDMYGIFTLAVSQIDFLLVHHVIYLEVFCVTAKCYCLKKNVNYGRHLDFVV